MTDTIEILFNADKVCMVYDERLNLESIGSIHNNRISNVDPITGTSQWQVTILNSDVVLGPFSTRTQAIEAEMDYIRTNNLLEKYLIKED